MPSNPFEILKIVYYKGLPYIVSKLVAFSEWAMTK